MQNNGPARRHILLCVVGLTPQIITETLYALTQQRGETINEIRVITTLRGRDQVLATLLDPDHGQFFAFCRDYHIDPASIHFDQTLVTPLRIPDGRMLDDIRSVEDNNYAANQICEIVRELTREPHTRLHASAAGGRKTMGMYLTAAMQLFGRAEDKLSHVLVSEHFETHRAFFYIPPTPRELDIRTPQGGSFRLSTDQAAIHLADIPFIRLRGVLSDWMRQGDTGYSSLVQRAQVDLDLLDGAHALRINLRRGTLGVATRSVQLQQRELFIYALLAYVRQEERGNQGFVLVDEITYEDADLVFQRMTTAAKRRALPIEDYMLLGYRFPDKLLKRVDGVQRLDVDHLKRAIGQVASKVKRRCKDEGVPESYLITTRGEGGTVRYGLDIDPQWIVWEGTEPG